MGYGIGYVESVQIIHLLVGDEELVLKNGQSRLLYANETWDIDALFIIPANVNRVELIVGWSKDATAKIPIEISLLPKPVPPAPAGSESAPQVQAGHLVYKLQKVDLGRHSVGPDGKPSQWALRCSIRIKEAMGYGIGYVESVQIIHLLVGDEELVLKNGQSRLLYANETWDIDALFIIPANVNRVELIVGWSKDATAKIPIEISLLPKPVPPAPAGSESAPQVQAGHLVYKLQKVDLGQHSVSPDGKPSPYLHCDVAALERDESRMRRMHLSLNTLILIRPV